MFFAIKMCTVVEKEMYIMEIFWLLDCVVDLVHTDLFIHPLQNFMLRNSVMYEAIIPSFGN